MKLRRILLGTLLFAATLGVDAAVVKDSGKGIVVQLDSKGDEDVKNVKLEVVNDNIIRVVATPESAFPEKKSLIVVQNAEGRVQSKKSRVQSPESRVQTNYTIEETDGSVILKTKNVQAVVEKKTGRITFKDANGNILLNEAENGKTFQRFRVPDREIGVGTLTEEQRNAWTWRALFDSPADEAFYGLGQHQSEDLNYKGKNEDLFQYNTKVSTPFVVSNKNYGLLWDTYSYCRWGNPEDYWQLGQAFRLFDRGGNEGQLTGIYTDAKGKKIVRGEDSIYFENSETVVNLPQNFNLDGSRVVYEGFIQPRIARGRNMAENEEIHINDNTKLFNFILYYAGYVRVFIDNVEVVPERWRTAWNPNAYKFNCNLNLHKKTPIRIEWQPDGGVSYCGLRVAAPQTRHEQFGQMSIWTEMARDMDYYFIAGQDLDEVISGYRTLTGKAQVYPKWTLGFWQSRERYKTSKEIEDNLAEFRKRSIPVDNIVQDWNYWREDDWGSHQFEPARYPNPQAMLDSVHAMHGRFMISVWPKFYCSTDNYKALDKNGWMYRQAVKDQIKDWVGPGYVGSFYDAYSPDARKLFWQQMDDNLYSKYKFGIDAWWMDASEPNVRDCTPMWYRKALCGPTALGSSTEYFNAYSIVNADAIYNGQRSVNPNQRVFLLTRSGFAGEQRYSTATWSGDIGTRWEDMRAQMTAGMNYSIAGLPFWGMDIGGFCVEKRYEAAQREYNRTGVETEDLKEWRELQTRWNQFGCFVPLYRTHGQWPTREVWNIAPEDHPAYKTIVWYDRLRYRLMPYLYSMAGWVHFHDYTMMRPLVMDFGSDRRVLDIKDQWMFGPAFMACPVGYYGARSREVYLPKQSDWYDLYTGQYHEGGRTITADAPYERMPVFVRAGSIVPFGPEIQWCDEKPAELINLYVYSGNDATFQLYEDEGTNYNYERGKYSTIDIRYDESARTLTIGARRGTYPGMLKNRRFNIVLVSPDNRQALDLDNPHGKLVSYSGKALTVSL